LHHKAVLYWPELYGVFFNPQGGKRYYIGLNFMVSFSTPKEEK